MNAITSSTDLVSAIEERDRIIRKQDRELAFLRETNERLAIGLKLACQQRDRFEAANKGLTQRIIERNHELVTLKQQQLETLHQENA